MERKKSVWLWGWWPVLGIALAYHGLSTFTATFKWDLADQFLPLRRFASQCLNAGIFPAWCPYLYNGYPCGADPSLGIWYLPSFLLERFTDYGVYTLQTEVLFHLVLAGWGFGFLVRSTGGSSSAAGIGATAFPLGGFVVFHLAHYPWIISLCWLLWYTAFLYRICFTLAAHWNYFGLSASLGLAVTGGYPFFHFLLIPITVVMVGLFKLRTWKQEGFRILLQKLAPLTLALLTGVLLSSGYLLSLFEVFPLLERAAGLTDSAASVNPFPAEGLGSLLFPGAALLDTAIPTDMSMRNLYCGLWFLPLLLIGFKKYHFYEWVLLFTGLLFLVLSLGTYTPVYALCLKLFPLLRFFRHPGIFVSVTYVCWMIPVYRHLNESQWPLKALKQFLIFFSAGMSLVLVMIYFRSSASLDPFLPYLKLSALSILVLFAGIWGARHHPNYTLAWMGGALVLDLMIQAAGFQSLMVEAPVSARHFQHTITQLPAGFPLPGQAPLKDCNHWGDASLAPMVHNASVLKKTPAFDGFNSFYFKAHRDWEQHPEQWKDLEKTILWSKDQQAVWQVFEPGKMVIQTRGAQQIEIMQGFYPGWKLDPQSGASLYPTSTGMMGIQTTSTPKTLVLTYSSTPLAQRHQWMLFAWMGWLLLLVVSGIWPEHSGFSKVSESVKA